MAVLVISNLTYLSLIPYILCITNVYYNSETSRDKTIRCKIQRINILKSDCMQVMHTEKQYLWFLNCTNLIGHNTNYLIVKYQKLVPKFLYVQISYLFPQNTSQIWKKSTRDVHYQTDLDFSCGFFHTKWQNSDELNSLVGYLTNLGCQLWHLKPHLNFEKIYITKDKCQIRQQKTK